MKKYIDNLTRYEEDHIMARMRKRQEDHLPIMRESLASLMDLIVRSTKPEKYWR